MLGLLTWWRLRQARRDTGDLVMALSRMDFPEAQAALNRVYARLGPAGVFATCWSVAGIIAHVTGMNVVRDYPDSMLGLRIHAQHAYTGEVVDDIDALPDIAPTVGAMRFLTASVNDDAATAAALFTAAHHAGPVAASEFISALFTFCAQVLCDAAPDSDGDPDGDPDGEGSAREP